MTNYNVENKWGGEDASWRQGGIFILSSRMKQNTVRLSISSNDDGKSFEGSMTYDGEGPISVKAQQTVGNCYSVQNKWGDAPWREVPGWIVGSRPDQRVVQLEVESEDGGKTLTGKMTYTNEGPISFKGTLIDYTS